MKSLILFALQLICLSTQSQDELYTWQNLRIGSNVFTGLIANPSQQGLFYVRTQQGGAYRWNSHEEDWIPLLDWVSQEDAGYLGVESIATDPVEPNRLYMLVGSASQSNGRTAILRSTDYGNTFDVIDVSIKFNARADTEGWLTGEKLVVDPNQHNIVYCGTRTQGLFKSIDYGSTWNKVTSFPTISSHKNNGVSFVLIDKNSGSATSPSQTIVVGVSNYFDEKLFVSKDGGVTFVQVQGTPGQFPHRAAIASDGTLYVTFRQSIDWLNVVDGSVWRYELYSGNWTKITPPVFSYDFTAIAVDPNNPSRVAVGELSSPIYVSNDKGSTWAKVISVDVQSVALEFDPFDSNIVLNGRSKVHISNGLLTSIISGQESMLERSDITPEVILSVPNSSLIVDQFSYPDVYAPGERHYSPTSVSGITFASLSQATMAAVGEFRMKYSNDRSLNWINIKDSVSFSLLPGYGSLALSANGNSILYCPKGPNGYRFDKQNYPPESFLPRVTTDKGETWSVSVGVSIVESYPLADPINSNKFYIHDTELGNLMVSTDGGRTFEATGSLPAGGAKIISAVPGREGDVWIAKNDGGLWRTENSGATFQKNPVVTYCSAIGFGKNAPGSSHPTAYIWGSVNSITGAFRSTDLGATWIRINDDDHEFGGNIKAITGDMNVFGRCYMITTGRGVVFGESSLSCNPTFIKSSIQVNGESLLNGTYGFVREGDQIVFSPETETTGSWLWIGPNGFTSTDRSIEFLEMLPEQAGLYTATFTNWEGCKSSQNFYLELNVISSVKEEVPLSISPNPTQSDANFLCKDEVKHLSIYGNTGQLLKSLSPNTQTGNIPMNDLPSGLYMIKLVSVTNRVSWKRIVKF